MESAFRDGRRLRRIAATLLALALLAERAAGASFPVRFLVLALLWRAHAAARAFVVHAIEAGGQAPEPFAWRAGPADAAILALRLRMLAAVIGLLSVVGDQSADRSAMRALRAGPVSPVPVPDLILLVLFPARRSPRPCDTS